MKSRIYLAAIVSLILAPLRAAGTGEFLYLSSPDGAQTEGRSGNGILIFDIAHGFHFVRRVEVPNFQEGVRGFTGDARTHRIYYSTTSRRLGCFDLEADRVLWERILPAGCDRSCVTPDGKKVFVPTGWWYGGADSGILVVDGANGDLLDRMAIGPHAHNSIATLDGRYVFLGTETKLTMFNAADDKVVRQFPGVGESGVFPYAVDSRIRYAYVCLGKHVGFDVVNLQTGQVPYRVYVTPPAAWPRERTRTRVILDPEKMATIDTAGLIPHRTHGVALTPDERELWISDQIGKKVFIFDATQMPPAACLGSVTLSTGGHGWVNFTLDGRYALTHTPDVIDVRRRQVVAILKDETGRPVSSSKFIEVHFRGGKVTAMGNEFGLGRAYAQNAAVE